MREDLKHAVDNENFIGADLIQKQEQKAQATLKTNEESLAVEEKAAKAALIAQIATDAFKGKFVDYGADGGRKGAKGCWLPSCPFTVKWLHNDMLKVLALPPVEMAKDIQDLEYLIRMVTELQDPPLSETWLDNFGTWKSVRDLTSVMHPEMCQIILQCIFSDPQVIEGIAFVEPFEGIEGKPAFGVLTKLKQVSKSPASTHARTYIHTLMGCTHMQTLGNHMKSRAYDYIQELQTEVVHINRILELQNRLVNLAGSIIMSAFIALGTFLSTYIYEKYYAA